MDQLEVLKKEWQNREQEFPKLSYQDIYKMLLKKSSSMVKWIFYISIGELILWTGLSFFVPDSSKEIIRDMGLEQTFTIINYFTYAIFLVFIVLFYRNYKQIQVTDTIKTLMENIIRTRRTVKFFVGYNIGAAILLMIGTNIFYYLNKDKLYDLLKESYEGYAAIPAESFTTVFFLGQVIGGIFFIGVLLLFYRLVYGILMRRLKRNYKELKKIEV